MATFTLVSGLATKTDTTTIGPGPGGRFEIRTIGLKATAKVKAKLVQNERFYLGFIQTCISNAQTIDYYRLGAVPVPPAAGSVPFEPVVPGPPATQKGTVTWTLSPLPCSDAASAGTRPWYGTASSMDRRRINIYEVGERNYELSMTDWFTPRPAQTVVDVASGATYHMALWKRKQKFSTWLAFVFESHEKRGALNYFPLWRFDWEYDGSINQPWTASGGIVRPDTATITNSITISNEQKQVGAVTMTKNLQQVITQAPTVPTASLVSDAAFTTSTANDAQTKSTSFGPR
jgi:hypothetical protein